MTDSISNDQQLRNELNSLSLPQQRQLGALFVSSVKYLCDDPRVSSSLEIAADPQADSSSTEEGFRNAKACSVETYAACGSDADWPAQAAHFVAAAAAACLVPVKTGEHSNLAWKAALQARMAKNCEMIEKDSAELDNEAQRQYGIAGEFLAQQN